MSDTTCAYKYAGYGAEPPAYCDEDPEENSDYCVHHGPNGGPDPDAQYDNQHL